MLISLLRHFDANNIEPRFEFGFGLSYTTFEYNGLNIVPSSKGNSRRQEASLSISASEPLLTSASMSLSVVSTINATATSTDTSFSANATTFSATSTSSFASNVTSTPTLSLSASSISASISLNASATGSASPAISSPAQTNPGGPAALFEPLFEVSYAISNTGKVDGHEVSQLYLSFPASAEEPPKVLRGFERTWIEKGKTENVKLTLRRKDVSVWDVVSQEWVVPEGAFTVGVGASSRDLRLTGTFVPSQ